jgi:hypothetical protein
VAEAFDGSQNLVCGLGPFEGLRVSVVQVDEAVQGLAEEPAKNLALSRGAPVVLCPEKGNAPVCQ